MLTCIYWTCHWGSLENKLAINWIYSRKDDDSSWYVKYEGEELIKADAGGVECPYETKWSNAAPVCGEIKQKHMPCSHYSI